jgi:hypothetical protein
MHKLAIAESLQGVHEQVGPKSVHQSGTMPSKIALQVGQVMGSRS